MQAFTRLDGPAATPQRDGDAVSIDQLRRGALAMASQLARASDGFSRHCRLAGSLFATAAHSELEDALTIWIEAAVRISAGGARAAHDAAPDIEPAELDARAQARRRVHQRAPPRGARRCGARALAAHRSRSRRTRLASSRSSRRSSAASPRSSPTSSTYREEHGFGERRPDVAASARALPRALEPPEEALPGGPLPRARDVPRRRARLPLDRRLRRRRRVDVGVRVAARPREPRAAPRRPSAPASSSSRSSPASSTPRRTASRRSAATG